MEGARTSVKIVAVRDRFGAGYMHDAEREDDVRRVWVVMVGVVVGT